MAQGTRNILAVGKGRDVYDLAAVLGQMGAVVTKTERFSEARTLLKQIGQDAVLIVLPVSFEEVVGFVKGVRADPELAELPIIYLSGVVEGYDKLELKKYNVHTFSLGPIPVTEMARYIIEQVL